MFSYLTFHFQQTIVHEWNRDGRWQDVEDVFRAAAHDTECPELVKEGTLFSKKCCSFWRWKTYFYNDISLGIFAAVQKTVKASSWTQSIKGIPTAGFVKAVRYGFAKINKFWKSLKKNPHDSE
jgi:translocator assembly and maintenance protein 41